MSDPLILAIDQGTTSSRALTFNSDGSTHALKQIELPLIMPHHGWVEQDPEIIWQDIKTCVQHCIDSAQSDKRTVASIGITNQRETTILWNKDTGAPIYNAIVWQDKRTAQICQDLRDQGVEKTLTQKTGLRLDPYFSATKIAWILDNVDGARQHAKDGKIAFGTIDSFLLWRLTNGKTHATDQTNAARTCLFNIHTKEWDKDLLKLFDIPSEILPNIHENMHDFGTTAPEIFGSDITIGGMAGDQHAALIGQGCFEDGTIKSTYGTGCFMLMNTGETPKPSQHKLLTTLGYTVSGTTHYALEGSIYTAGSLIQWLRDQLQMITSADKTQALATSVEDNGGVYIVPALTGLGAPYWEPESSGIITGLKRSTTRAHIIRAALEAQAYQTYDLIDAMQSDAGTTLTSIKIDGGLVNNDFAAQHIADILQISVHIPHTQEATAWGAAILAGIQSGIFTDLDEAGQHTQTLKTLTPQISKSERDALYEGWKKAVAQALL